MLRQKNRSFAEVRVPVMRIHHKKFRCANVININSKMPLTCVAWHTVQHCFSKSNEGEWFFPFLLYLFFFFFFLFGLLLLTTDAFWHSYVLEIFIRHFYCRHHIFQFECIFHVYTGHDRNSNTRIVWHEAKNRCCKRYFHRRICYIIIIKKVTFTWH